MLLDDIIKYSLWEKFFFIYYLENQENSTIFFFTMAITIAFFLQYYFR